MAHIYCPTPCEFKASLANIMRLSLRRRRKGGGRRGGRGRGRGGIIHVAGESVVCHHGEAWHQADMAGAGR